MVSRFKKIVFWDVSFQILKKYPRWGIRTRVPKGYRDYFKNVSIEKNNSWINKGIELPSGNVLLVVAKFVTTKRFFKILNIPPLTLFGFNKILPIGEPVDLLLSLSNVSENNGAVDGFEPKVYIFYPNNQSVRNWTITIPKLNSGESRSCRINNFFIPEVPGVHRVLINRNDKTSLISPFGIFGREFQVPGSQSQRGVLFHFYAFNPYEYLTYIIVTIALIAALVSLIF